MPKPHRFVPRSVRKRYADARQRWVPGIFHRYMGSVANLLLGGVLGAVISASVTLHLSERQSQLDTVVRLDRAARRLFATKEAWILEGPSYRIDGLHDHPNLPTKPGRDDGRWLRKVEIRTVLDQEAWNVPPVQPPYGSAKFLYGILGGRRAWIVRNRVTGDFSHQEDLADSPNLDPHPALISSEGLFEIAAWLEEVARAYYQERTIDDDDLHSLWRPLYVLSAQDRADILEGFVADDANRLMKKFRRDFSWKFESKTARPRSDVP